MRLLGKSEQPLGLQPIARELGLVPSTCLYVLRALVEEGLVGFDPVTKRYRLGGGRADAGAAVGSAAIRFADLAQPSLDRVARAVRCHHAGGADRRARSYRRAGRVAGGGQFPPQHPRRQPFPGADQRHRALHRRLRQPLAGDRCAGGSRNCAGTIRRASKSGWSRSRRPGGTATRWTRGITSPGSPCWRLPVYSGSATLTHALVALGIDSAVRSRRDQSLGR